MTTRMALIALAAAGFGAVPAVTALIYVPHSFENSAAQREHTRVGGPPGNSHARNRNITHVPLGQYSLSQIGPRET